MTRPLQHLEGVWCACSGLTADWSPRPEGGWFLLLRRVEVRPFDPAVPLLAVPPVEIDHLWTVWRQGGPKPLRNDAMVGLGTVGWYRRRDGTVDLGVRHRGSLEMVGMTEQLAPIFRDLRGAKRVAALRAMLDGVEERHRRREVFLLSTVTSTDEAMADLRRLVEREEADLQRSRAAAEAGAGVRRPEGLALPLRSARRCGRAVVSPERRGFA